EANPLRIDGGRARRHLGGDELADHLEDLPIEGDRLGGVLETSLGAVALLGERDERLPVDAALEVVGEIVVVLEEVHRLLRSSTVSESLLRRGASLRRSGRVKRLKRAMRKSSRVCRAAGSSCSAS